MGTNQENIDNQGAEIDRQKTRCVEATRVSLSILNGILSKMDVYVKRPQTSSFKSCCTKMDALTSKKKCEDSQQASISINKPTSMSSLIIWNITKALELNPYMDLKSSIKAVQQQLGSESRDMQSVIAQYPETQHLVCALLAWQQLGHHDAESLYKFIESARIQENQDQCGEICASKSLYKDKLSNDTDVHANQQLNVLTCIDNGCCGSRSSGPVVKLPVETKVIMRMDSPAPRQMPQKGCKGHDRDTMNKIDAACCLESACVQRLAELDATTKDLRSRASKLARREAERVELLERAEAAWKDLEIGYQRRLVLAEEKEEDLNKQIQKLIADRNGYKTACTTLSSELKGKGDAAEKVRAKLTQVEKQVCDLACIKLRLSEEAARGEAAMAEHQCRATQLERDLQFKEEQARRKLLSLENAADSARALTHEAERALRAELSGLREQIAQVSNELLSEDEENVRIKEELDQLRQEKYEMVEDLEGCKVMCDLRMQGRVDELQRKKDQLNALKDQLKECRCKMPVDEVVEVKRTPSLAALCRCAPEDRLLESCSCTSLRGKLLTNLLADLFGGLQTELSGSGSQMPCQLLKCLEDKHNWDRASVVKTNLRNFFSKLLVGELDIAIATAIENYHAKWVGASCADVAKLNPEAEDELTAGWEQRALERRAQKMATKLAEQLFQERAEQLAQRARDIVRSGPPPCDCKPHTEAAAYPCILPTNTPFGGGNTVVNRQSAETPSYWKRTINDVTQLRLQIEDLKKESIKKEDLKLMEEKITQIVKQASGTENKDLPTAKEISNLHSEGIKKETKHFKSATIVESPKNINQNKSGITKKKLMESNSISKKSSTFEKPTKQSKKLAHGQAYAVNLCLCGPQKNGKSLQNTQLNNDNKPSWKQKPSRDIIPQNSSVKQTKPININIPTPDIDVNGSKASAHPSCNSNCKCFHKVPSNTSIDKLLETLAKWKCDLADPQEKCIKHIKSSLSKYSKNAIKASILVDNPNDSKINLSASTVSHKEQVTESDIYKDINNKTQFANFKQPAATESEYMGAVNLDKSNENICKCINKVDSTKENNQDKNEIPFKCINCNACECKVKQDIKDNKPSQTDDLIKAEVKNQFQSVQTNESTEYNKNDDLKSSNNANNKTQMERKSDINNSAQETELFPSNCDYYIKFLGVTLADSASHKKTKTILKDNTENLNMKDKYIERKKRHKKIPDVQPSNSFIKPNVVTVNESHLIGTFNQSTKCECNAKFDEFKSFMTNVFTKQLQEHTIVTHKDEGLDSQSFKHIDDTIESCVCCNKFTVDDSKDLEVNAFHLLEDHLKGKLEEFKSFTCQSACIPPEEEEKLFSAILHRVKQVISDSANEMKCRCPGSLPTNGSWNRAYGLLQEYLKIKIKRVQCLCVLNNKKDLILPDILDRVCNLIEHDFQRLKDICKCKKSAETSNKNVRIEDVLLYMKDVPEKDISTKDDIVDIQQVATLNTLSKQNSNKSMILTENISSQVPPNLGMETKSCEVMQLGIKNAQTTETDAIITDSKSNGVMYKTCDCSYNTVKVGSGIFGTKELLVSLYTDTNDICQLPDNLVHSPSGHGSVDKLGSAHAGIETNENHKSKVQVAKNETNLPYIGYTVDCSCVGKLGSCVCMKSVIQANNDKIDSNWKEFLANSNTGNVDCSYIMHGAQKKDNDALPHYHSIPGNVVIIDDNIPTSGIHNDGKRTCETEVNVQNRDSLVLKTSHDNFNTIHHTTNTFGENLSVGTSCTNSEGTLDWFECPVPINSKEKTSTVKLSNSIYFPVPINNYNESCNSNTFMNNDTTKSRTSCHCNKVPICHVKMLVENIEKNLIESNCTCDSGIEKICPVHSKKKS